MQSIEAINDSRGNQDRPAGRLPAGPVAEALDEIIDRLPTERPYTVYRRLARQAEVHPTTVLRCHQGQLVTASKKLVDSVNTLLANLREQSDEAGSSRRSHRRRSRRTTSRNRVSAARIRQEIQTIQDALGLREHQFLYRYLADTINVHPTTILRYHRGDLQTAPKTLLNALHDLRERILMGDIVSFQRGRNGTPLILRERILEVLHRILDTEPETPKSQVFRDLDQRLDLKPGTIGRIYYDRKLRFVSEDVHQALERIALGSEYDPCLTYEVGVRIKHHLFGTGQVLRKVHKNKILVEFSGGERILLCEGQPSDPFLQMMYLHHQQGPALRQADAGSSL